MGYQMGHVSEKKKKNRDYVPPLFLQASCYPLYLVKATKNLLIHLKKKTHHRVRRN